MRPQPATISGCKPVRDTQTPVWDTDSQPSWEPISAWQRKPHMKKPLQILILAFILHISLLVFLTKDADAAPIKGLPCPEWHNTLRKHGLPVRVFAPIMYRESRCIPKAVGWNYKEGRSHRDCKLAPAKQYRKCNAVRSYDVGLLQINSSWRTLTKQVCKSSEMLILQKPSCNLKVAKILYKDGEGISNWKATSGGNITNKKS